MQSERVGDGRKEGWKSLVRVWYRYRRGDGCSKQLGRLASGNFRRVPYQPVLSNLASNASLDEVSAGERPTSSFQMVPRYLQLRVSLHSTVYCLDLRLEAILFVCTLFLWCIGSRKVVGR